MVHKLTTQFQWKFSEYQHREKSSRWLAAFLIVIISGGVISILIGNSMLAGIILLSGILMLYLARREPKQISLEISERGIKHDEELYPYEKINLFWITDTNEDDRAHLLFVTDRNILPMISVPLPEGTDLLTLREFLSDFIQEQELREPWVHKLVDHLGI